MARSPARVIAARRNVANLVALGIIGTRPLPILPLAAGALVHLFGDSQTEFNHTAVNLASDKAVGASASGPASWAHAIDPRFNIDTWFDPTKAYGPLWNGANNGIQGNRFVYANQPAYGNGMLPIMPEVLSHPSKIVVFVGGFNTLNNGDGESVATREAYMIAQYEKVVAAVRAAGKHLVIMTLYPTDLWAAGDARYTILANVNTFIRSLAAREGVRVCDPYALLAPGGVLDPSLFQVDVGAHIHLSPKGAYLVGRDYLLPILQSMIAAGTQFSLDSAAVGNLFGNSVGRLLGTSGSKTTSSGLPLPTGTVATGCTLRTIRGTSTTAASIEADGIYNKQVLTITPVADSTQNHQVNFTLPLINAAAGNLPALGSWVRSAIRVEMENAEACGLAFSLLEVKDAANNAVKQNSRAGNGSFATFGEAPHVAARSFYLITPPMQITADTYDQMSLAVSTFWDGDSTRGAIVAKFSRPEVLVVPDPRPAWGF